MLVHEINNCKKILDTKRKECEILESKIRHYEELQNRTYDELELTEHAITIYYKSICDRTVVYGSWYGKVPKMLLNNIMIYHEGYHTNGECHFEGTTDKIYNPKLLQKFKEIIKESTRLPVLQNGEQITFIYESDP